MLCFARHIQVSVGHWRQFKTITHYFHNVQVDLLESYLILPLEMYDLEYINTNHVCVFSHFTPCEKVSCPTRPVRHADRIGNVDPSPSYP